MGFKKRIISLLLAASMIVSICPISALGTVTVSNDIVTTEPVQSVYAVDANNLTAGAFTYTVLDETSCQITGYTGILRLPFRLKLTVIQFGASVLMHFVTIRPLQLW